MARKHKATQFEVKFDAPEPMRLVGEAIARLATEAAAASELPDIIEDRKELAPGWDHDGPQMKQGDMFPDVDNSTPRL